VAERRKNYMNNCVFIGRLARDPETTSIKMKNGDMLAKTRMTVAIDRPGTYGDNKKTDFLSITVLGKQAESAGKYLTKGRQVAIQAHVQTGSYEKDGNTVYTTDFIADRVEFLGNGHGEAKKAEEKLSKEVTPEPDVPDGFEQAEEDIPF
jgi:single-strand DNA-binding protein